MLTSQNREAILKLTTITDPQTGELLEGASGKFKDVHPNHQAPYVKLMADILEATLSEQLDQNTSFVKILYDHGNQDIVGYLTSSADDKDIQHIFDDKDLSFLYSIRANLYRELPQTDIGSSAAEAQIHTAFMRFLTDDHINIPIDIDTVHQLLGEICQIPQDSLNNLSNINLQVLTNYYDNQVIGYRITADEPYLDSDEAVYQYQYIHFLDKDEFNLGNRLHENRLRDAITRDTAQHLSAYAVLHSSMDMNVLQAQKQIFEESMQKLKADIKRADPYCYRDDIRSSIIEGAALIGAQGILKSYITDKANDLIADLNRDYVKIKDPENIMR